MFVTVVTLKKCEVAASPKIKLLKNSQDMPEGKWPFEKKSQTRLVIMFN